jgi:hypothetical protein
VNRSCWQSWRGAPALPGADVLAFADTEAMQKREGTKQGAAFGHTTDPPRAG